MRAHVVSWLNGDVALVTGGASGLGRAIVERFVREGARVGVLDRSLEKLEALKTELGADIAVVQGDVTSLGDNERAVAETVGTFGRLDCLVGNAGIHDGSIPLVDMAGNALSTAFDELFGVNVKGYILGAKAALGELVRTNGQLFSQSPMLGSTPVAGGCCIRPPNGLCEV